MGPLSFLVRLVLIAAGLITGVLLAGDDPAFGVVQGMVAIALVAAGVGVFALLGRR